ncbi:thioesterase domain-containing protein [Kitasatospora acidiphila]|uniref:thioesterase domain-containing protein n=1 Tax=Kitasatospora acidiphila TaxID=2567942 RepID=UPI001E6303A8|nr:thioesterase domain-containing protein [Kitasatospora acidiphila]
MPSPASIPEPAAGLLTGVPDLAGGPYALFGVSLGALVAYELALAAEAAGQPPALLALAACSARSNYFGSPRSSEGWTTTRS